MQVTFNSCVEQVMNFVNKGLNHPKFLGRAVSWGVFLGSLAFIANRIYVFAKGVINSRKEIPETKKKEIKLDDKTPTEQKAPVKAQETEQQKKKTKLIAKQEELPAIVTQPVITEEVTATRIEEETPTPKLDPVQSIRIESEVEVQKGSLVEKETVSVEQGESPVIVEDVSPQSSNSGSPEPKAIEPIKKKILS